MEIKEPEFIKASGNEKDCPSPTLPEFAFIGRSNVGKSSLINMLCQRKDLAKTSSSPGKTRSINHFLMDKKWYLVDLPGYGYARVSKTERERFEGFITDYILERSSLAIVCVLIDSRIPPQAIDLEFINWRINGCRVWIGTTAV
ncbi:MAG: YihA family ribosome biogenesis GTP-binding protein, partial [Bacteroidetes bacterium]|nr:YihA family ribosome biogenesis GTP-binding protein [Bacteroidota bacterium]